MFYSKWLFIKKGPMSKMWVAGTYINRLSKHEIMSSNIPELCDLINDPPEKVIIALRISATLLAGVCKIENKQTAYISQSAVDMRFKMRTRPMKSVDLPANRRIARLDAITHQENPLGTNELLNLNDLLGRIDDVAEVEAMLNEMVAQNDMEAMWIVGQREDELESFQRSITGSLSAPPAPPAVAAAGVAGDGGGGGRRRRGVGDGAGGTFSMLGTEMDLDLTLPTASLVTPAGSASLMADFNFYDQPEVPEGGFFGTLVEDENMVVPAVGQQQQQQTESEARTITDIAAADKRAMLVAPESTGFIDDVEMKNAASVDEQQQQEQRRRKKKRRRIAKNVDVVELSEEAIAAALRDTRGLVAARPEAPFMQPINMRELLTTPSWLDGSVHRDLIARCAELPIIYSAASMTAGDENYAGGDGGGGGGGFLFDQPDAPEQYDFFSTGGDGADRASGAGGGAPPSTSVSSIDVMRAGGAGAADGGNLSQAPPSVYNSPPRIIVAASAKETFLGMLLATSDEQLEQLSQEISHRILTRSKELSSSQPQLQDSEHVYMSFREEAAIDSSASGSGAMLQALRHNVTSFTRILHLRIEEALEAAMRVDAEVITFDDIINEYTERSNARTEAARAFSELLTLQAGSVVSTEQSQPFGDIAIRLNKYQKPFPSSSQSQPEEDIFGGRRERDHDTTIMHLLEQYSGTDDDDGYY